MPLNRDSSCGGDRNIQLFADGPNQARFDFAVSGHEATKSVIRVADTGVIGTFAYDLATLL
jgi:hypothetical protein